VIRLRLMCIGPGFQKEQCPEEGIVTWEAEHRTYRHIGNVSDAWSVD
jgi:hypothetical protein